MAEHGDAVLHGPGRANLIGEHTDYTFGRVLPFALTRRVDVLYREVADHSLFIRSMHEASTLDLPLSDALKREHSSWLRYPVGVLRLLASWRELPGGMALRYDSDVPVGSGVSSSAALLVATALAAVRQYGVRITREALVRLCQRVEHEVIGVQCGTLDFWASIAGEADHALAMDLHSGERQLVPMADLSGWKLVLAHSRVHRELAGSAYNQRREECAEGQRLLEAAGLPPIHALSPDDLRFVKSFPDAVARRVAHVVTENFRVVQATKALRNGEAEALGRLLDGSHASLRDDFQVSCEELDELVELARGSGGAAGARMMGGGFGGCVLMLVAADQEPKLREALVEGYYEARGAEPLFINAEPGDGAAALHPELFGSEAEAGGELLRLADVEALTLVQDL